MWCNVKYLVVRLNAGRLHNGQAIILLLVIVVVGLATNGLGVSPLIIFGPKSFIEDPGVELNLSSLYLCVSKV